MSSTQTDDGNVCNEELAVNLMCFAVTYGLTHPITAEAQMKVVARMVDPRPTASERVIICGWCDKPIADGVAVRVDGEIHHGKCFREDVEYIRLPEGARPEGPRVTPTCWNCGQPAECFGSYEGHAPEFSCGTCCQHGDEDGSCDLLADVSLPALLNKWVDRYEKLLRAESDSEGPRVTLEQAIAAIDRAVYWPDVPSGRAVRDAIIGELKTAGLRP